MAIKGELLLGDGLSNKFIEKLIEDTRKDNLKWFSIDSANGYNDKYTIEINQIGKITIECDELGRRRSLLPSAAFILGIGEEFEIYVDTNQNSEYYANMGRLFRLAKNSYAKQIKEMPKNIDLTQAITAYINAD